MDARCTDVDVGELTERQAPVLPMAYRPDGGVTVTVGSDDTIRFWDAAWGSLLGAVPSSGDRIAFDEEGNLLIAGADGALSAT